MSLYNVRIQADYKPKSPWQTTVQASSWPAAVAKACRDFQKTVAKRKHNLSWGIRCEKVVLDGEKG